MIYTAIALFSNSSIFAFNTPVTLVRKTSWVDLYFDSRGYDLSKILKEQKLTILLDRSEGLSMEYKNPVVRKLRKMEKGIILSIDGGITGPVENPLLKVYK